MVVKPVRFQCFYSFFGLDRAHSRIAPFQYLTNENVTLIYSVTSFEHKTKVCAQ